jgi:hypothetical protein
MSARLPGWDFSTVAGAAAGSICDRGEERGKGMGGGVFIFLSADALPFVSISIVRFLA